MADIQIERVRKDFGQIRALDEITLHVADGAFVALLGPSGCGKTTLLRIIAGLETQSGGRIVIGGRDLSDVPTRSRGLAMVFQNYAVFPHMNVFENIAFGLRMQGAETARVDARVKRAAGLLHIETLLDRYPARLSGGQRQRVAVARALAVEPPVLLMDEPLSNLDALLRLEMRADLKAILQEAGTTTIYVTHDQTEAMGLADRIAVMHGGKIVQFDAPMAVYSRPQSTFVGGFVGSPPMNFIKVEVAGGEARLGALSLRAPVASGPVLAGVRAEDFALVERERGLPFNVLVVEPLGSHALMTGRVADQVIRVVAPPDTRHAAGAEIGLAPVAQRIVWMDAESGQALGKSS
ncbi:MAG TPA: ABC transporter ATP-binding protein [Dongiaceae bacterium]|jgi:multiple sugar transport system ATP-binding protein|nr:ABC transporter ATP-binding protein [Dongiaceae bacterium]